ncbi:MAG: LamG domain-containing protein [Actinomycetota bacterium]
MLLATMVLAAAVLTLGPPTAQSTALQATILSTVDGSIASNPIEPHHTPYGGLAFDVGTGAVGRDIFASLSTACPSASSSGTAGAWSGNGVTAGSPGPSLSGSVSYGTGVAGSAFVLTGSGLSSTSVLPSTGAGSVMAWVKATKVGVTQTLVSRSTGPAMRGGEDVSHGYALRLDPAGVVWGEVDDPSSMVPEVIAAPSAPVLDGSWHHVAASWAPGSMAIFVDGIEVARQASRSASINPAAATPFLIGGEHSTPFGFTGSIDEVVLFDRAVAASELVGCMPPVRDLAVSIGFTSSNAVAATWSAPLTSVGNPITSYTATASATGWSQTRTVTGATNATFDNVPYAAAVTVTVTASDGVRASVPVSATITSGDAARPVSIAASTVDTSTVSVTFGLTRSIAGTSCSVFLNGSPFGIGCTGGNIGGLSAGTTYAVTVRASGPSGTYDVAGPNVSTASPPPSPSVTLTKGASAAGQPGCSVSACRFLTISYANFGPGSHTVTSNASTPGDSPFYTYVTSNNPTTVCYYGFSNRQVWVTVDGVQSNIVTW